MITQQVILTTTVVASGSLSAQRFVGINGALCAEGKQALGIAEISAQKEEAVSVNVLGILAVESGGNIAPGDAVQSDSKGRAIVKATGIANGVALDAATGEGSLIRILRGA